MIGEFSSEEEPRPFSLLLLPLLLCVSLPCESLRCLPRDELREISLALRPLMTREELS